jgi:choline dehydrogenase-like flavoprotein
MLEAGGSGRTANEDDALPETGMQFGNVPCLTNHRSFGGNANLWNIRSDRGWRSVRLLPLSTVDFEERPWLADSGWPIWIDDLADYYRRAQVTFQLSTHGFTAEEWEEPWARALPLDDADVSTGVYQFGTGHTFLDTYRQKLESSENIKVLYNATTLEVLTNENASHASALRVASLPDRTFHVRANHFVLAAGGLVSAQLLLASDATQPDGLGNAYGNVGRYFMDHPLIFGGEFLPASPRLFDAMAFYDLRSVQGTPIMGYLQLSDRAVRREELLNLSAIFLPRERNYQSHRLLSTRQDVGFNAALRLRHALRHRERFAAKDAWLALKGLDGVAKRGFDRLVHPKSNLGHGGWSAQPHNARRFDRFEVLHQAEQAPHRDNRVSLSRERNRFGARRLHVDWRWHEEDLASVRRGQEVFARALARAGLGQFQIARGTSGEPVMLSASTSHYMGTTRMHADPRRGVVDPECRVHGVDNLFVASSSVFPTGGFANPTLTVVALALRIADRIRWLQGLSKWQGSANEVLGLVAE